VRAYDLMAAGLFYINVTGAGLIAWLDFMQGRSLSRERDASCRPRTTFSAACCAAAAGDDLIDCQLLRALAALPSPVCAVKSTFFARIMVPFVRRKHQNHELVDVW
jgi:hypothetical protein